MALERLGRPNPLDSLLLELRAKPAAELIATCGAEASAHRIKLVAVRWRAPQRHRARLRCAASSESRIAVAAHRKSPRRDDLSLGSRMRAKLVSPILLLASWEIAVRLEWLSPATQSRKFALGQSLAKHGFWLITIAALINLTGPPTRSLFDQSAGVQFWRVTQALEESAAGHER